jgi:hypothetical protein
MMTGAFKATYVFGYIVAAMFVLFFLVLVAAPSEFVGEVLLLLLGCSSSNMRDIGCNP